MLCFKGRRKRGEEKESTAAARVLFRKGRCAPLPPSLSFLLRCLTFSTLPRSIGALLPFAPWGFASLLSSQIGAF